MKAKQISANLEELLETFDRTTKEFIDLLSTMDEYTLNTKPDNGGWSPGQIGHHILKSYGAADVMNGRTEPTNREPGQNVAMIKREFLDFNIRMESPEAILPTNDYIDQAKLITDLRARVEQMRETIKIKDLNKTCIDFSIPEFGQFTILEWAWFNTYHTMRHLHQLKDL